MTTREARDAGYTIGRGAYHGTCDDRIDRWYHWSISGPIDKRGVGFRTRAEALADLVERLRRSSYAAELGRRGGAAKTDAKGEAARINGKRGGRPRSFLRGFAEATGVSRDDAAEQWAGFSR
jgi:hypothetical protein